MTIKLSQKSAELINVLVLPAVFLGSYILLSFYENGDQVHYHAFYSQVSAVNYFNAIIISQKTLGSAEPVSVFLLWLGSYLGFEKNLYISFLNSLMIYLIFKASSKNHVPLLLIILLIFNFYTMVLMTGAERLKLGYIFLVAAFLTKSKFKFALFILGCISHYQLFLLLPSILIYTNYRSVLRLLRYQRLNKWFAAVIFGSASFCVLVFALFSGNLVSKINSYFSLDRSLFELVNLSALFFISVFSSSNYKKMILSLTPFFVLVLLFGGDRINMLATTFCFGALILESRLSRPLPVLLLLYFVAKSVVFIQNIMIYGHGFP